MTEDESRFCKLMLAAVTEIMQADGSPDRPSQAAVMGMARAAGLVAGAGAGNLAALAEARDAFDHAAAFAFEETK